MEVKTNKEYQAMQKEMAAAEHDVRAHEDKLLEHMEHAETFAAELKAAEAALKAEQTDVARDQKILEAERAEIEQELARLTAARKEVVAMLPRDALSLFERVAHGRKGVAVAEARDGLCTVCHVRLRPQMFNEVRRNDGLHQCDSCTRILVFRPGRGAWRRGSAFLTSSMIVAYIDGGARGNPGPAGYGVRIQSADGAILDELHGALGIATNNVAEYNGLLAALRWAVEHNASRVHIRADSELLVKQMRGEYKVKNPGLQPLYVRARLLVAELDDVKFEHVRREFNKEADRLSNLGMDEAEARLKKAE